MLGLENHQILHHFLTSSTWDVEELREQRLSLILQRLQGRPIILIIDKMGDRNLGKTTDYVKRQYIGNLGKIDWEIVAVTAYAVLSGITFSLMFDIDKPRERLQAGDLYRTFGLRNTKQTTPINKDFPPD